MLKYSEKEMKEYALSAAETIVIRSYNNGCSSDDERQSTDEESEIIYGIIYGGLLAINHRADERNFDIVKQSIKDACEFIGNIQMRKSINEDQMNGYDTIYNRIEAFFKK